MALRRFVIKAGINDMPGTMFWEYNANEDGVNFTNGSTTIDVKGNFIGKRVVFRADGPRSEFLGLEQPPKDERCAIMWKYGFTRPTRIQYSAFGDVGFDEYIDTLCGKLEGSNFGFNSEGQFVLANNIKKTVLLKHGVIMVASAIGRIEGRNDHIRTFYLNPRATVSDVKRWESMFNEVDKNDKSVSA